MGLTRIHSLIQDLRLRAGNLYNKWYFRRYQGRSPEDIFSDIYDRNRWNSSESRSGTGSETTQTQTLVAALPQLFKKYDVKSVLDIPCGDWNWMAAVDLDGINYLGADIIDKLIQENNQRFQRDVVRFERMDILLDQLPGKDLIICRDCLVHFSYRDIYQALNNLYRSGATYLLTTTFPEKSNIDIPTGGWRPINLNSPPFNFQTPLLVINENCTEGNGRYQDKSLGLWKLSLLEGEIGRLESRLA